MRSNEHRLHGGYRSYLLRIWRSGADEMHAILQEVATGRSHAFTSLDQLRSWLEEDARVDPDLRTVGQPDD